MATKRERERREARVGLGSNVIGLSAGIAATGAAARNPALRRPAASPAGPVTGRVIRRAEKASATSRLARAVKSPRGRAGLIAGGAAGALGLQVANTAGDVITNRVLLRESKGPKSKVAKRKFDAEADRQRRLGAYAGLGGGAALVMGEGARRSVSAKAVKDTGKTVGILVRTKGARRKPALLAAGALASGIAGAAAYKRGISERNKPWN